MSAIRVGAVSVLLASFPGVLAACSGNSDSHWVGGTISGLTSSGLVLAMPREPDLSVTLGQSEFTFATRVASGTPYSITVKVQPSGRTCLVADGSGVVGDTDITDVRIDCVNSAFVRTGSMKRARAWHSATLLSTGKVLVAGGCTGVIFAKEFTSCWEEEPSAEVFNPATGDFTLTGQMNAGRVGHSAILLPDGSVLLAGGEIVAGIWAGIASAERYDPATGTFSQTGNMTKARMEHSATLLPDGSVLVAGGRTDYLASPETTAELYNPASGIFSPTAGNMHMGRAGHTATLLPDGRVLVVGGGTLTAELYNPVSGTFDPTGDPHKGHGAATLLPNGQVLMTGAAEFGYPEEYELYDPSSGSFILNGTGTSTSWSDGHSATLLSTGMVLIVGSEYPGEDLASAELYDPVTSTYTPLGDANDPRLFHTATLLPNGQVLLAGSGFVPVQGGRGTISATAEIYVP